MAQGMLYIALLFKFELSHLRTFTFNTKIWNPRSSENFECMWKNWAYYGRKFVATYMCVHMYLVFGLWEYIGRYTVYYQKLIAKTTEL